MLVEIAVPLGPVALTATVAPPRHLEGRYLDLDEILDVLVQIFFEGIR